MPDLKELLGSAYKEGMTFDEASAALKDRKLVDLSSGEYVSKGKYDSAVKERDDARKERDGANTKYKDYDELVKYRKDAEAAKQATILAAEAEKEKEIREAEGRAQAILSIQKATADGIRMIREAGADEAVIKLKSLEAFSAAANGQATKIIIPSEIQGLAGLVESLKEVK